MAVESARLVAGNEVTAAMPAAGFRERAGYHRTRTTRCPSMGAVRVPGSTRHQDARMSPVIVLGSDWPPAPARFNAPRGGLRAASICNHFVAAQVEETEPRRRRPVTRPPRLDGRRGRVAGGGNARRRRKLAPTSLGALRPLTTHAGLRGCAKRHRSTRVHEDRNKAGPTSSARAGDSRGGPALSIYLVTI